MSANWPNVVFRLLSGYRARLAASVPGCRETGREEISVAARRDRQDAKVGAARRAEETEAGTCTQRRGAVGTVQRLGRRPAGPTERQQSYLLFCVSSLVVEIK